MTICVGYLAFCVICLIPVLIAAWRAPVGYEDETGFHYGIKR